MVSADSSGKFCSGNFHFCTQAYEIIVKQFVWRILDNVRSNFDAGDPGLVQHLFLETSQINIFLPQRTLSRISVNDVLWACEQHTGADPGFPRRVASLKGGGTNILFGQNFQKTA